MYPLRSHLYGRDREERAVSRAGEALMRVQSDRTDVLPLTWEIPATLAVAWAIAAVLAVPLGQGLALLASGRPFAWPSGPLLDSMAALLSGSPGRGLPEAPSRGLVWACIVVTELIVAAIALRAGAWWWRTTGPGTQFGLASLREVRAVLGAGPLRRRRTIIRPDLHGRARVSHGRRGRR